MEEVRSPVTRECDFDKDPTLLYLELQKKDWEAAVSRAVTDPGEARTWVVRKEFDGKLRWRLLPLHAAIIFKAPEQVIEALLGAYPGGAECKDDQGMLPLHLAFRNGSTEGVVNLLLVAYPQSIDVKDRKGRIPLVLAQASTSPNRDAFMRALERGPTYYAVAAAATERAAVTAELRAIFDAKLMEIKNQHQDEIDALKEDALYRQQELEYKIVELETELNKTQETSQILVDHVNSLEAQLTSRSDTERFLATKIATLDTSLRDVSRVKEETETSLQTENKQLLESNESLKTYAESCDVLIADLKAQIETLEADNQELAAGLGITKEKSVEEIQRLEMEWATARASAAVLEAQLKKKIETEHSLACQVSSLASKLAESAYESSSANAVYTAKIEALNTERSALRNTVGELTKKLTLVANELIKVSNEQDQIIQAAGAHEASMMIATEAHAKIMENAHHHESVIERINDERRKILDMLVAQEQEILDSAEKREHLREVIALQAERHAESSKERGELVSRVNQQMIDVRKIVEQDLDIIPTCLSQELDQAELIDEVVRRANAMPAPDAEASRSAAVAKSDGLKYAEVEASLKIDAEKRVALAMESVMLNAKKNAAAKKAGKVQVPAVEKIPVVEEVEEAPVVQVSEAEDEKKEDDEGCGVEVLIGASTDNVEASRSEC
jgi:chromosome segregation ATPase